jgi:hypothetical protein
MANLSLGQATLVVLRGHPLVAVPRDPQGLMKLFGLFTALAVSAGAPFWFDALGKLVSLRASGPPPKHQPTTL